MENLVDLQSLPQANNKRHGIQIEIAADGMSLDLLRAVYRNPGVDLSVRMRAAMACLLFESPKLAVTALIDNERDFATILDRRLARLREMENAKLIDAKPEPVAVEVKAPTPSMNYRSLRRRI
jgi:hypothetical protein